MRVYPAALMLFLAGASGLSGQPASEMYRIRTAVDLVVLDVAVTDRRGRFVPGLRMEHFEVLEDGNPQRITMFRQEDQPVSLGLIIDSSTSMLAKRKETVSAALALLDAGHPGNEVFVLTFNDRPSFALPQGVAFTSDPQMLLNALNAPSGVGRTALYDAAAAGLRHVESGIYQRKVLVVFSDGADNQSTATLPELLSRVEQSAVTIYTIGLFDRFSPDGNRGVLNKLATTSGGQAYFPGTLAELKRICQRIAADIRGRYVLGYAPEGVRPGEYRPVVVRVNASGHGRLKAKTREGFRVPQAAGQ